MVQLKEGSKIVLPSFVELVVIKEDKVIDLELVTTLLAKDHIKDNIEKIELFYNQGVTKVVNVPSGAIELEL